jgi:hypothetical protein
MTIDQKVRYGMMALAAASFLLASLGMHIGPLDPVGGVGPLM